MPASPTPLRSKLHVVLAGLFGLYSLLFVGIVAIQTPPYQNPDETNHVFRAEQLGRFGILPERLPNGVGGAFVDVGIADTAGPFLTIPFHPERKVTRELYAATNSIAWGRALAPFPFPNTVIYPPTLYLPAIVGIWIGKATGSPVVRTLYIARIVNGICATAVAASAIALADGAAIWLFAVLTLPMSMALFAAVSQDGTMIAGVALAAAIVARARHAPAKLSDGRFALLCLVLIAVCMARPPYVPIAGLILVVPWRGPALRAASLALVVAATAAWSLVAVTTGGLDVTASVLDIDPKRQLAAIVGHPSRVLAVVRNTYRVHGAEYLEEIVGRLGNLDAPLPPILHLAAWTTLAVAAIYSTIQALRSRSVALATVAVTFGCGIASIISIFAIEYLTFTSVGNSIVEGVQGRYFVEILILFTIMIYNTRRSSLVVGSAVVLSAIFYMPEVVRAIALRYYF